MTVHSLLLGLVAAAACAAAETWPPHDLLVRSLAAGIEPLLASQDQATGKFGTQPWICTDQNVLMTLAAAWSLDDPNNPWHHSDRVLAAIANGGEALVDEQDPKGMWIFRKKDNSTWGQIWMPWTYSRWIRAYVLVKDALPPASRGKWERGLLLGFKGIRASAIGSVHNIPTHHAMALYIAGVAFDNADWRDAAKAFMPKVVAKQNVAGFWSEHFGPVVGYNEVYIDALGVYYSFSKDPAVLPALERAARFHSAILWPNGSSAAAIDERQVYHAGRELGNAGFSWTDVGRGFLVQQTRPYVAEDKLLPAEYAASMLLYAGQGDGTPPAAQQDQATVAVGDDDAVIRRDKPWQWCLSGYACDPIDSRWIQDRQNLIDVYHDDLGLVVGGGNSKVQPYWSTFTVGDPSLLSHKPGDESPDFTPEIDLAWTPSAAMCAADGSRLDLTWGGVACSVDVARRDEALALTYRATPGAKRVEAHVPLLNRGGRLELGGGEKLILGEDELLLDAARIGGKLVWKGLEVELPEGASLRWPARQHNPYAKDGRSPLGNAKLVIVLPFGNGIDEQTVVLRRHTEPAFAGLIFDAQQLAVESATGTRHKPLPELGSVFLGAEKAGESLTFTLPAVAAGKYELSVDFVLAPMYGVVRLLVDGQAVGKPFDGYAPDVDAEGERGTFGTVELAAGAHQMTLELVGRNEHSEGWYISARRFLLGPLRD